MHVPDLPWPGPSPVIFTWSLRKEAVLYVLKQNQVPSLEMWKLPRGKAEGCVKQHSTLMRKLPGPASIYQPPQHFPPHLSAAWGAPCPWGFLAGGFHVPFSAVCLPFSLYFINRMILITLDLVRVPPHCPPEQVLLTVLVSLLALCGITGLSYLAFSRPQFLIPWTGHIYPTVLPFSSFQ